MKLYTRTGDKGFTTLPGHINVPKACAVIKALGAIDELQVSLGMVAGNKPMVATIRKTLWKISGQVAGYPREDIGVEHLVQDIEAEIDRIPISLTGFVGFSSIPAVYYDEARVRCRRVERELSFSHSRDEYLPYFNRLSDLLFAWAVQAQPDVQTYKSQ